jgi:1-acyl-sn-glycerol-3-phosphate acyltransferase
VEEWKLQPARDLGLPLGQRWKSLQRESGLVSTALHVAWWGLVKGYMAVWHRLAIHGREHIPPAPPFVMVANHESHLDAFVLACPLPWRLRDRIFPIAAGDTFFETPVLTAFAATMLNALPLWRKKHSAHALEQLRQRLVEEPCAYILFPEGTRSRDGTMTRFKAGLGMLVAQTSVPVVPCYLDGCFEALRPGQKFPRWRHIRLRIGAPLVFTNVTNDRAGWLHIAAETETRVKGLATETKKARETA